MSLDFQVIPFGTYRCPHCGFEFDFRGSQDRVICPNCTFDLTTYAIPKPVRDPINTLAVQFAEQNRQDHRTLRAELDGLRHVLAAIVNQEGGTYLLGDRATFLTKPDAELHFRHDTFNRCLVIKTTDAPNAEKPSQPQSEPTPDWML